VNKALLDSPQLLNSDPYHEGWMIQIKLSRPEEISSLMSSEEYEKFLEGMKA